MIDLVSTWHCVNCDTQLVSENDTCPNCNLRATLRVAQQLCDRLQARIEGAIDVGKSKDYLTNPQLVIDRMLDHLDGAHDASQSEQ